MKLHDGSSKRWRNSFHLLVAGFGGKDPEEGAFPKKDFLRHLGTIKGDISSLLD